MTFTGEGLVLGGAILAPLHHDRDGVPEICAEGQILEGLGPR